MALLRGRVHYVSRIWGSSAPLIQRQQQQRRLIHNIETTNNVRLSKRLSELGLCSRREAAKILKETSQCNDVSGLKHFREVIYLRGKPVMDGTAVKVSPDEKYIEVRAGGDPPDESEGLKECSPYAESHWDKIRGDTIVLNKPIGYVSGQEEHQHVPAVRLLTRDNMHLDGLNFDKATQHTLRHGSVFNFAKWKFSGFDKKANSVPRHIREQLTEDDPQLREKSKVIHETLAGYAPAGRLDIDSTGVLIFTQAGIMARRLIQPETTIPKEYIVKVKPVIQPTSREIEMGLMRLPRPTRDLRGLLKKGNRLWNEKRPLKPLLRAEWLDDDTMRLVLVEGKKRQIRRMCRELLGWHVVSLCRTSVGPVRMDSLPEGKWRPLTQEEVKAIFKEQK